MRSCAACARQKDELRAYVQKNRAASGQECPHTLAANTRHALEHVGAAVVELDPRSDDEILHGAGDEDLAGPTHRGNPGADVHGDSADVVGGHLNLSGVKPGTNLHAEIAHPLDGSGGTADAARRSVEDGEDAVPGRIYLPAAMTLYLPSDDGEVSLEELAPPMVADCCRTLRRSDDVGEQYVARTRSDATIGRAPVRNSMT